MYESILKTFLRDGCIIPFNKNLNRIRLNKILAYGFPALEEFPEYILVMIPPTGDEYSRPYFSNCKISTDGFEFGTFDPAFVHEWMPRIKSEGVGSVTIFGGERTPYVGSSAYIKALANSGKRLMNHIYRLSELQHDVNNHELILRYRALPFDSDDAHAVEIIQHWLRDLLGLPTSPYNRMYEKIIKARCAVDPWLKENPNMRLPDDYLRGHRLTDSESMDLIFDGDVPHGDFICALDADVCRADVLATLESFKYYMALKENNMLPGIKKVIFNKPCTIVLWEDGTKTMVRTQGKARFDKEKGLAMCIAKKALGNEGNYYDEFRKWVK